MHLFMSLKSVQSDRNEQLMEQRVKSGRYRVQGAGRASPPRRLFTRGASEVITAAAALL